MTDDRDLYEAIENLYALDPQQQRLITLWGVSKSTAARRISAGHVSLIAPAGSVATCDFSGVLSE